MSEITIARRYAQALYEAAEEAGRVEQVDADVAAIQAGLDASRELRRFFGSPVISREKKRAVVEKLFGGRVEPVTLRFLQLLVEKRREALFPTVVKAYGALRDERLGIVEAKARTAQPLTDDEERALAQALEKMTGRRIRMDVAQAPELIGGVVIRVGDTVYDGSVRHQLESLRERLEHGSFLNN